MSDTSAPGVNPPPTAAIDREAGGWPVRAGTTPRGMESSSDSFRYVDSYGLLLCLGEGGMGEVWAARDPSALKNRIVALKTTKQQGSEAARVLWDEARIASLIEHPNVCRVHELGLSDGVQYLVMDYCDGASLHDLLEKMPQRVLPPAFAARILSRVAAGLHAAHELTDEDGQHLGVVHRDVSPQNVLLSTSGHVTVTDFGVAKALGQAHKTTETGEMKGKLSYMAPEQITSRDVDRRADVFALGCVLYQVTLGQRPFHGDDALATLYQLLEKDLVTPRELDPSYPPELEEIVLKALRKDREERFATAAEMQLSLEHFLVNTGASLAEADVAELLLERLGPEIRARKAEIRKRVAELDGGTQRPVESQEKLPSDSSQLGGRTTEGTVTDAPPAPARSSTKAFLIAAAVLSAVALGSVLVLRVTAAEDADAISKAQGLVSQGAEGAGVVAVASDPDVWASGEAAGDGALPSAMNQGADEEKPNRADAEKVESSTETPSVSISVNVMPSVASILLDGEKVGVGNYETTVEPSTQGHLLRVEAPGYKSLTRAIVFDRDQNLELSLRRRAPLERSKPPRSDSTVPPASRDKPPQKSPRPLDSTNPFATP